MKLTVASYNIRHGVDAQFDWNRLASVILTSRADLVGLQEVDMGTARSGGRDTLSGLLEATGFSSGVFIPAMDFDGGQYGTAVLSRYPVTASSLIRLDSGAYEPRACGCVTVDVDGSEILFFNTHLSYESKAQRAVQFRQLAEHLPADKPFVLTGDFNTEVFAEFDPLLGVSGERRAALVNGGQDKQGRDMLYKTFRKPPCAIDNIVYASRFMTLTDADMIHSADSDHNLLWGTFAI